MKNLGALAVFGPRIALYYQTEHDFRCFTKGAKHELARPIHPITHFATIRLRALARVRGRAIDRRMHSLSERHARLARRMHDTLTRVSRPLSASALREDAGCSNRDATAALGDLHTRGLVRVVPNPRRAGAVALTIAAPWSEPPSVRARVRRAWASCATASACTLATAGACT